MALIHDTEHVAEALALLCQQYKGKPSIEGFVGVLAGRAQLVEDALATLQTQRLPAAAAIGVQLDAFGTIVRQLRNGNDDAHYLPWLQARMMANVSGGAPETVLDIINTVCAGANAIHLVGMFPASFVAWIAGALPVDPVMLAAIISDAKAGGVGGQIVYSLTDDAHTFTFSSGNTEEASVDQGWAPVDQSTGGKLAGVEAC